MIHIFRSAVASAIAPIPRWGCGNGPRMPRIARVLPQGRGCGRLLETMGREISLPLTQHVACVRQVLVPPHGTEDVDSKSSRAACGRGEWDAWLRSTSSSALAHHHLLCTARSRCINVGSHMSNQWGGSHREKVESEASRSWRLDTPDRSCLQPCRLLHRVVNLIC